VADCSLERKCETPTREKADQPEDGCCEGGFVHGGVSRVLNGTPAAKSIPKATQERILEAARQLNYRSNLLARSAARAFAYGRRAVPEKMPGVRNADCGSAPAEHFVPPAQLKSACPDSRIVVSDPSRTGDEYLELAAAQRESAQENCLDRYQSRPAGKVL
jgi:hypothetical protein